MINDIRKIIIILLFFGCSKVNAQAPFGYEVTAEHVYTSHCTENDVLITKTSTVYDTTLEPPFTYHYLSPTNCAGVYFTQIQDKNGRWVDIGNNCLSNPGAHRCGVIGKPGGIITVVPIYLEPEKQFGMPMECTPK